MSLQRVLELARRQAMPVVITDIAGREPLVVLPLDIYESLVDGSASDASSPGVVPPSSPSNGEPTPSSSPSLASIVAPAPSASSNPTPAASSPVLPARDGLRVRQRDEDRVSALHRSLDTVSAPPSSPQASFSSSPAPSSEGLFLEERFSFQP